MNNNDRAPVFPAVLYFGLAFALLAAAVAAAGYGYFWNERRHLRENTVESLSAIADMKVHQTADWRRERISDAQGLAADPVIRARLLKLFARRADLATRTDLVDWTGSLCAHFGYENITFTDPQGESRLTVYPDRRLNAASAGQGMAADLVRDPAGGRQTFCIAVPLDDSGRRVGTAWFEVDPAKTLFPLLESWPVAGHTAESLLARREGEHVVFLNEPKYGVRSSLPKALPLSRRLSPAVQAVSGYQGSFEGIDYRGEPVISAVRVVPGTGWYLVVKIDRDEVYQPLRRLAGIVSLSVVLLTAAAGWLLFLLWQRRAALFAMQRYEREWEQEAVARHGEYTEGRPQSIILLLNKELRIVQANDGALAAYGYASDELLGLRLQDLCVDGETAVPPAEWKQGEHPLFEDVHRRKDGTAFTVEISARFLEIEGREFYYLEARDVSIEGAARKACDDAQSKHAEELIRYIVSHDSLTGLYNRSHAEKELRGLDESGAVPTALVIGDISHFRITNDVFGHAEGDALLKKIAESLQLSCRPGDCIARWGSDEFLILLPRADLEEAQKICRRIRQTCARIEKTAFPAGMALGAAVRLAADQPLAAVLKEAEERMNEDKLTSAPLNRERAISALLERINRETHSVNQHVTRMQALLQKVAPRLSLTDEETAEIENLIRLHEIGKVALPQEVMVKQAGLTSEEWEMVRKYPEEGSRIARAFGLDEATAESILSHRERWDGGGYPRGLKGSAIPAAVRLFSLLDTYDIMMHPRPYGMALTRQEAVEQLRSGEGSQFDPGLTEQFIAAVSGIRRDGDA